jgi:hypothetical protein
VLFHSFEAQLAAVFCAIVTNSTQAAERGRYS